MKRLNYFYLFVITLSIVVDFWLLAGFVDGSGFPMIRSDGDGYYIYLPTLLIHKTLDFNILKHHFTGNIINCPGIYFYAATGKFINAYPIGVAVLISPFFLMAHALTKMTGLFAADGYSLLYQCSPLVSALFYYLLGTYFLFKSLLNHFSENISLLTIVFITFGTSLFHYTTFDSPFSHVYSFCLVSLLVYLTRKFWLDTSLKFATLLGITMGFLFLIRNYNLIYITYFFLYPIQLASSIDKFCSKNFQLYWVNTKKILTVFLVLFITITPQLLIWKALAGNFIVYSYGNHAFNWLSPRMKDVLFSTDKGLFFWSPTLIIAVLGLGLGIRQNHDKPLKITAIASTIILFLLIYIISSWQAWNFGASYGHRGFVDAYAFFAFGLAIAIEYSLLNRNNKILNFILLTIFTLLVNVQMYNYWIGVIPFEKTKSTVYIQAIQQFPQRLYVGVFVPKYQKSSNINSGLKAQLISMIGPKIIKVRKPGQDIAIKYSVVNTGKSYWQDVFLMPNPGKVSLGILWFPQVQKEASCKKPAIAPVAVELIPLPKLVAPGEKVYIQGSVQAPKIPGQYTMLVDMISDRVAWFGDVGDSSIDCYNIVVQN
ncbi:MAG TPA: hypothetical protein V6C91_10760 [Coleofasciculaceae cyanobacterium]